MARRNLGTVAAQMFTDCRAKGIPAVITGHEAAMLSIREIGRVAQGLKKYATSNSQPVQLARACDRIVRDTGAGPQPRTI